MKNFGLEDLLIVDPPPIEPDGEAHGFAGHAREDVLPNRTELSFEELAAEYHTIAFTATTHPNDTRHVRYPFIMPTDLADALPNTQTALVFGPERTGLSNDQLAELDRVCSIPAADEYPTLNLGQAVTVACYELRDLTTSQHDDRGERASPETVDRLHDRFAEYLAAVDHPTEKRDKAARMFRRLIGRAQPTGREARTLMGLFRRGHARLVPDEDAGRTQPGSERERPPEADGRTSGQDEPRAASDAVE
jgi:tRNA (cytidine32/uridine32-2'-O)-methyltransferase